MSHHARSRLQSAIDRPSSPTPREREIVAEHRLASSRIRRSRNPVSPVRETGDPKSIDRSRTYEPHNYRVTRAPHSGRSFSLVRPSQEAASRAKSPDTVSPRSSPTRLVTALRRNDGRSPPSEGCRRRRMGFETAGTAGGGRGACAHVGTTTHGVHGGRRWLGRGGSAGSGGGEGGCLSVGTTP